MNHFGDSTPKSETKKITVDDRNNAVYHAINLNKTLTNPREPNEVLLVADAICAYIMSGELPE